MLIRANEIKQYMELHGVKSVPLEAVCVDVPAMGYRQKELRLSKSIIVSGIYHSKAYNNKPASVRLTYHDAEQKKFTHDVPEGFEFEVVTGDAGQKMLNDLAEYEGG